MKGPTASEPVKPDFKRNRLLQFLLMFYLALWAALENLRHIFPKR